MYGCVRNKSTITCSSDLFLDLFFIHHEPCKTHLYSGLIPPTINCIHPLCTSFSARLGRVLGRLWHLWSRPVSGSSKLTLSLRDCGTFCSDPCVNVKEATCLLSEFLCSADLFVLFSTWHDFYVYSCMHSCDVSLCVGSRGAWIEVHVG